MSARVSPAGAAAAAVGESSAPWLHAQSNSSSHQLSASDHLPLPLPYNVLQGGERAADRRAPLQALLAARQRRKGAAGGEVAGSTFRVYIASIFRGTAGSWHAWAQAPARQSSRTALSMPHAHTPAWWPTAPAPLPPHCPTSLPHLHLTARQVSGVDSIRKDRRYKYLAEVSTGELHGAWVWA